MNESSLHSTIMEYTFDAPRRQYFPFPSFFIDYLANNSKGYEKLQKSCKYFFSKKNAKWELKRGNLKLFEEIEIGKGTFGKVYLGEGNNITSACGTTFGRCAIKTIPEGASNADRLHFLIKANIMKQFNTEYIVKLFGVVSEGPQPVLIVMEMMDQGNFRDYLVSRRPGNFRNNPLPSMISYFKWAAQIADGMAYLESLNFCHGDLAAKNCLVANDDTVKIGDFGMARYIYYQKYYKLVDGKKRLMPFRWMAPESLKRDEEFNVK